MKNLFTALFLVVSLTFVSVALADSTVTIPVATDVAKTPVTGFGPSIVGTVGAFYFNGDYSLLSAGFNAGTAYTFTDKWANVNSVGLYIGPQSQQIAGVISTSLNTMIYANLYQTSTVGFGVGLGTRIWQSGMGMDRAITAGSSYLALGCKF